ELMNANDTSEQVLALVPPELHKYLTVHPRNATGNSTERYAAKNVSDILRAIYRINEAQTIYNEDIFGPVQNDTIIIAIQGKMIRVNSYDARAHRHKKPTP
ncbi:jg14984, partial [Pararge aegeria aegeria]